MHCGRCAQQKKRARKGAGAMSRRARTGRTPLWARLLPQAAPEPLSALLPLLAAPLAAPLATMGMAAASSTHDLTALESSSSSRSFVFGSSLRACAICLEEYLPGDRLRMLEPCAHCFHQTCIDGWLCFPRALTAHACACPVCNVALVAPCALPFQPDRPDVRDDHHHPTHRPPWPSVQLIDLTPHQTWAEWFTDLLKLYYPHNSSSSSPSSPSPSPASPTSTPSPASPSPSSSPPASLL
ncbi:unnamed protein product [Agarophyton chilense]